MIQVKTFDPDLWMNSSTIWNLLFKLKRCKLLTCFYLSLSFNCCFPQRNPSGNKVCARKCWAGLFLIRSSIRLLLLSELLVIICQMYLSKCWAGFFLIRSGNSLMLSKVLMMVKNKFAPVCPKVCVCVSVLANHHQWQKDDCCDYHGAPNIILRMSAGAEDVVQVVLFGNL